MESLQRTVWNSPMQLIIKLQSKAPESAISVPSLKLIQGENRERLFEVHFFF